MDANQWGRDRSDSFHQCAYDLALSIGRKAIHDVTNIRYRSRRSQEENALDFRNRSRRIKPWRKGEKTRMLLRWAAKVAKRKAQLELPT